MTANAARLRSTPSYSGDEGPGASALQPLGFKAALATEGGLVTPMSVRFAKVEARRYPRSFRA